MYRNRPLPSTFELTGHAQADARNSRRLFKSLRRHAANAGFRLPRDAGIAGSWHGTERRKAQARPVKGWLLDRFWGEQKDAAVDVARTLGQAAAALVRAVVDEIARAIDLLKAWRWRRIAQASALAAASGLALAGVVATKGYAEHAPAWVQARLAERQGSMLYDRQGDLIGVRFEPATSDSGAPVDHQAFGYAVGRDPVPALYGQLLLHLEHQHHFSWRNWWGIDFLSIAKRALTGSGGGSALAAQLAKQLAEPDEQRSDNWFVARYQKVEALGATASLHRALGGPQGVFEAFVAYAPVAQINGTTRGAEAGSRLIFGVPPARATPAQLAVLASLVQRPLALVDPATFAPGCPALRAMTPENARAAGRDTQVARGLCLTLARARVALKAVLPEGPALTQALADLETWERTGLQPVERFAPLPARKLLNLSTRTQALLGAQLVQYLADEADALSVPHGTPLTLTLDADEQQRLRADAQHALQTIDVAPSSRELLCVKMTPSSGPRHCAGVPDGYAQAQVLLARVRLADGGFTRLYLPTGDAWEQPRQTGSIAKLVIVVAAVAAGYDATTPVCPRAASDGDKRLRRDSARAPYGYPSCAGHMMPFHKAVATSDSLVFYDVARRLGPQRLLEAAKALALTLDDELSQRPAYALSFGTLQATPAQMLALGQAVFALAYGVPVQAAAPRLLTTAEPAEPQAYRQLANLLPRAAQREQLRQLVQAPVQHVRGTLRSLARSGALAGKSGTTSSAYRPAGAARPYVQAKLALTYQPADATVALSIVAGAEPQPLAQSHLPGAAFDPLRQALVR